MTAANIARALEHGVAPHDASDPVVTWTVMFATVRIGSGIPSRDAAVAHAVDYCGPIELLEHGGGASYEIDGQAIAFIPFACAERSGSHAADGMIMPELRCRACRRSL